MADEMSIESHPDALKKARTALRRKQRAYAIEFRPTWSAAVTSNLDPALGYLERQTRIEPTASPEMVTRAGLKFNRTREEERIAYADELIRRVAPGPAEDPNYMAILAYQAASIEMVMSQLPLSKEAAKLRWQKFLLGTLAARKVNAFAHAREELGFTIVLIHSALIDFIYQAAKAVTEVWTPRPIATGLSNYKAESDQAIRSALIENQSPVNRLYKTIEAYFFYGYPRAFTKEKVPEEQAFYLNMLVGLSERFIIGHEYTHGLARGINWERVPGKRNWVEEYFADESGLVALVLSAAQLDGIPPERAVAGAVFSLACFDLLRRSSSILRTGQEGEDKGTETHPPTKSRIDRVVHMFYRWFDVEFESPTGGFDLNFVMRKEAPKVRTAAHDRIEAGAFEYMNCLLTVWEQVAEMLLEDHKAGRPVHPTWLRPAPRSRRRSSK